MAINKLNHAVLFVRDVAASVAFYRDVLGFQELVVTDAAAFMRVPDSTNDHDLGLFGVGDQATPSLAGRGAVGLYHLAWEVDTLSELARLRERLTAAGALVGSSDHGTTKSLYAHDPDGLEFEVCWLVPADAVLATGARPLLRPAPLDLDAEISRYGADLLGGVGLPVPMVAAG